MKGIEFVFYQRDWLDIPFVKMTNRLPSSNFYNQFYKTVFKKYSSYDDLPLNWRKEKKR